MENLVGLAIESLVAVLLAATIVYCAILDRRLKRFRTDEGAMRKTIAELVTATGAAERAIAALRDTVGQCEDSLAERLASAQSMSQYMEGQLGAGEEVIGRIAKIAKAAREHASQETRETAARQEAAQFEAARLEAARIETERLEAERAVVVAEARRVAEEEEQRLASLRAAREADAAAPLSASAATAAAAELFASRIRALSLGAAA